MKKRSSFSPLALLGRASMVALVIGFGAGLAQAQKAFQGVPSYDPGVLNVSQGEASGAVDRITLFNSSTAIINWTADDTPGTGPVDFLPEGKTAIFESFSNFTVLNRILPANASIARVMELNGTVQSTVNGTPGGSVWFYAPGGIVAGANSVFNVGSLVLTSNDIDTTDGLFGPSGEIRFRGATNQLSSVEVRPGASISALSSNSYVALVAPRVVQGGTVKVNGTAAYVAAEAADIRIDSGLFDISISAGTTDPNGVVHSGTTERESSTVAIGEAQRVYMVAVPKNNALTMLLSGDVGYSAADVAVQEGSTVVLAAGYDVAGTAFTSTNPTATGKSSIQIGASTWQPELNGRATGDISLRANAGQAITAGAGMNLAAGIGGTGGRIELLTFGAGPSGNNGRIDVAGDLRLSVDAFGQGDYSTPLSAAGHATAGDIVIAATGGSISAGRLLATANASSAVGSDLSGNATGGSIHLSALTLAGSGGAEAGRLNFGDTALDASARVDDSFYYPSPISGGSAMGGSIDIAAAGGSFTAQSLSLHVNGAGGDASSIAGSGSGGDITLSASAANGLRGSFALTDCSFTCAISATGFGGTGLDGATGMGGTVLVHASDADFTVTGGLDIRVSGLGGGVNYSDVLPGRGGDGIGGTLTIESRAGSAGTGVMHFGDLSLSADGGSSSFEEEAIYSNAISSSGGGGDGVGGTVNILVAGGSLIANAMTVSASAFGSAADVYCESCGGNGPTVFQSGSGRGGSVGLLMTAGSADIGSLELVAQGTGGEAASGYAETGISALAGQGVGGDASLDWRGGALTAGSVLIDASGNGGSGGYYVYEANGGAGGEGIGGSARLMMAAGGVGQIAAEEGIIVRAAGWGGDGADSYSYSQTPFLAGSGGTGRGGAASVTLAGGALVAPSLFVSAAGSGGAGGENQSSGPGGAAGDGFGGMAHFSYLSEGHDVDSLTVAANGEGGLAGSNRYFVGFDPNSQPVYAYGPANGSAGGAGTGGTADMLIDVDPSFVSLDISADGIGSAGGIGTSGGAGGFGQGGVAALNIGFGATSVSSGLRVSAVGVGGMGGDGLDGSGGRGGNAAGGSATLGLTGSSTSLDAGDLAIVAEAVGGAGGISGFSQTPGVSGATGGSATGGDALFEIASGASATTGAILKLSADAVGGAGSAGTAGPRGGAGGSGGDAVAGSAILRINGGRWRYAGTSSGAPAYSITATAMGGAGAAGGDGSDPGQSGGVGGNGGIGTGGAASFEATDGDYLLGNLSIIGNGTGGLGGAGGSSTAGATLDGVAGLSSGGSAQLLNGGAAALIPGAMRQLAALSMMANGAQGGHIQFTDNSTGAGGGLTVTGPLNLHAVGARITGFTGIDVAVQANAVQVGGDVDLMTEGPLSFAFAGTGGIAAAGALTGYSGAGIAMNQTSRPVGSYGLSAASLYLQTPGAISLAGDSALRASGPITMLAGTGISAQALVSGGSALLNAGAGDLVATDIAAAGPITASGRNIILGARGGMTIASAIASGNVALSAGGLLTLANQVSGAAVTLGSSDIVIGPNAQILATGLLRFGALAAQQPAIIGGTDATGGYSLSAAELARVSAANLAIDSAGDMIVRDLTVGTAMIPGDGILSLNAAGLLRVEGALALTGRMAEGGASLSAGDLLQVIAGSGSIDISDGNGALAGLLSLSAPVIQVASLSAIEDLASMQSLGAKEARLAQNDGLLSEDGWLRAGTLQFSASQGVYVQNSGVSTRFADRRGFTANSLTLSGAGAPQVAINGRMALPGGEYATGITAIPLMSINGRYAAGSKINGCLIGSPGSCTGGGTGGVENRDTLDRLLDPTVAVARIFPPTLIQLRDVVTQGYPPLIDEPVTGAGNEDLWESPCSGEGQAACDAQ